MTEKEAAAYLGLSPYYLRNLRHLMHDHEGPAFTMVPRDLVGRRGGGLMAWYQKEDLDAWRATHKFRKKQLAQKVA